MHVASNLSHRDHFGDVEIGFNCQTMWCLVGYEIWQNIPSFSCTDLYFVSSNSKTIPPKRCWGPYACSPDLVKGVVALGALRQPSLRPFISSVSFPSLAPFRPCREAAPKIQLVYAWGAMWALSSSAKKAFLVHFEPRKKLIVYGSNDFGSFCRPISMEAKSCNALRFCIICHPVKVAFTCNCLVCLLINADTGCHLGRQHSIIRLEIKRAHYKEDDRNMLHIHTVLYH